MRNWSRLGFSSMWLTRRTTRKKSEELSFILRTMTFQFSSGEFNCEAIFCFSQCFGKARAGDLGGFGLATLRELEKVQPRPGVTSIWSSSNSPRNLLQMNSSSKLSYQKPRVRFNFQSKTIEFASPSRKAVQANSVQLESHDAVICAWKCALATTRLRSKNRIGWFGVWRRFRAYSWLVCRVKNNEENRSSWQWHAERLQDDVIARHLFARRRVVIGENSKENWCHGCEEFSDEIPLCSLASTQKPWSSARPFTLGEVRINNSAS